MVVIRDTLDLGIEIFITDFNLLEFRDLLKGKTGLDLLFCLRTSLLTHGVKIHTGVLEVHIKAHALHTETGIIVSYNILDFGLKHSVGDVCVKLVDKLVDKLIFNFVFGIVVMSTLDFCLQIGFVFIYGIEFGYVLCELIVDCGKLDNVYSLKLYLENRSLARKLGSVILFGEGNIDIKFITDGMTDDLILNAGNKLPRSELKRGVLCFASFKSLSVAEALIVDLDNIVVLSRAVGDFGLA